MSKIIDSVTLHSTKAGADKIYRLTLTEENGAFDVTGYNGRRGGTLTTQPKERGITYETARTAYDKVVRKKLADDYRVIEGDVELPNRLGVAAATGIPIALSTMIDEAEALRLAADPEFWLQEKHNGERRVLVIDEDAIYGVNKKGFKTAILPSQEMAADRFGSRWARKRTVLDAEVMGGILHVFDAQSVGGIDLCDQAFDGRMRSLLEAFTNRPTHPLQLTQTVQGGPSGLAFFAQLADRGAEGVIIRHGNAPYVDGRAKSGVYKFKWLKTASAIVIAHNARHSVGLGLYEHGNMIDVGNVTLPPSLAKPDLGTIIEVRYQDIVRGGSLYQPAFLGVRNDVSADECTTTQLVFKGEPNPLGGSI